MIQVNDTCFIELSNLHCLTQFAVPHLTYFDVLCPSAPNRHS